MAAKAGQSFRDVRAHRTTTPLRPGVMCLLSFLSKYITPDGNGAEFYRTVALTAAEGGEILPLRSTALTVYVWVVPVTRPVSV